MKKYFLHKNEYHFQHASSIKSFLRNIPISYLNKYTEEKNTNLYQALAEFHHIETENLFVSAGLESILLTIFQQIKIALQITTLIIPSYSWDYYKKLANYCFYNLGHFKTTYNRNTFLYDYSSLFNQLKTNKSKLILLPSPNNPTGHTADFDYLNNIVKAFPFHIFLIDEAYAGFAEEQFNQSKFLESLKKYKNIIIGRSFSKYFGLAGLRFGYAILNKRLKERLSLNPFCLGINRITEEIVKLAIKNQTFYKKQAEKTKEIRKWFIASINNNKRYKAFNSKANFVIIKCKTKKEAHSLHRRLLINGFLIKKFEDDKLSSFLRISLAPKKVLKKILKFF